MNIIEIIYLILLWLLVGGYITILIEVKKLTKFKEAFIEFMKMQRDVNNAQVEHNKNVSDYLTITQKGIERLTDTIYYCENLEKETRKEEK